MSLVLSVYTKSCHECVVLNPTSETGPTIHMKAETGRYDFFRKKRFTVPETDNQHRFNQETQL
jgi:hypothetical protein